MSDRGSNSGYDDDWDDDHYDEVDDDGLFRADDYDNYDDDDDDHPFRADDYGDEDEHDYDDDEDDFLLSGKNDEEEVNEEACSDTHMYMPREHANEVLQMLKAQFTAGQHLDLSIKTSFSSDNLLRAHKCLLAACSPYIRTYFQNSADSSSLDLSHLNGECVSKIVDWCYTGCITLCITDVQDFLVAADFLCIDQVFKNCTDFILRRLSLDNCAEIYSLSCSFQACDFKNKVKRFILNNPADLFTRNLLGPISKEEMLEIVADPSLVTTDDEGFPMMDDDQEFRLFQLVQHFITHHKLQHYWPELLQRGFRLSVMSEEQLRLLGVAMEGLPAEVDKESCFKTLELALQCKKVKKVECMMWTKPRKNLENLHYYTDIELATSSMHEDQSDPVAFNDFDACNGSRLLFIVAMRLWVRSWGSTQVVGGIEMTYNNGSSMQHGGTHESWEEHCFTLEPGEKIVSVVVRSGWVIDSLLFHTNRQRSFGPYGGRGGGERVLKPKPSNAFLATIKGCEVKSMGALLIRRVSFVWGYLKKNTNHWVPVGEK